jgi:hypothetical protein
VEYLLVLRHCFAAAVERVGVEEVVGAPQL